MRADVNLSVREVGAEKFGTRTEMKNLNSFKAIAHAIDGERARQIELLEEGKAVIAIYSHNGYEPAQSSDYDKEREAQKLIQELNAAN